MRKVIGSGAEAIIYLDKDVIKDRVRKGYRIEQIDSRLRKSRTKREAKVITTLQNLGFSSPKLVNCDDKQQIVMEFIDGQKLRDVLESLDYKALCEQVGQKVAFMHAAGIIHGDLTTSNMILKDEELYLIDFGLSFFSKKVEDMAVDLHLLRQALESKHYRIWKECFESALDGYKKQGCLEVLKRLELVERRGRYKGKG
ncbi:MAG: KEOPS complex kinase/ATPase Bud32 [Candidatus Woesearchaeota archaeon]